MLKEWEKKEKPEDEDLTWRLKAERERLQGEQMKIKEHKLPVLVLVEGWGTAGKGFLIAQLIKNIDPRFFKVVSVAAPTEEEQRKPFLYRHVVNIPEEGKFCFLDSGWMDEVVRAKLHKTLDEREYERRVESIRHFERQLTDNGYLVIKLI